MRSERRAPSTTVAPCAERCRVVACPSPLLAPVMTTTFPAMPSVPVLVTIGLMVTELVGYASSRMVLLQSNGTGSVCLLVSAVRAG